MNDLLYILKVCGMAISILIMMEISLSLIVNQKGRAFKLKSNRQLPNKTAKIYSGFISYFFLSILGLFMYILDTRIIYLNPGLDIGSGVVYNWYLFFGNLTIFCFNLALLSIPSALGTVSRKRIHVVYRYIKFICLGSFILTPYNIFTLFIYATIPISILCLIVIGSLVKNTVKILQTKFILLLLGMILFTIGIFTISHFPDLYIEFLDTIIPELLFLASLATIAFSIFSIPSLHEIFAPNYIEELFIGDSGGQIISQVKFKIKVGKREKNQEVQKIEGTTNQNDEDEMLTTTIIGIDGILHEMSSAKGLLKTLVLQNKILIIEKTPSFIGVLVTHMDLQAHRYLLGNFLQKIESIYGVPSVQKELSKEGRMQVNEYITENSIDFFNQNMKKNWNIN